MRQEGAGPQPGGARWPAAARWRSRRAGTSGSRHLLQLLAVERVVAADPQPRRWRGVGRAGGSGSRPGHRGWRWSRVRFSCRWKGKVSAARMRLAADRRRHTKRPQSPHRRTAAPESSPDPASRHVRATGGALVPAAGPPGHTHRGEVRDVMIGVHRRFDPSSPVNGCGSVVLLLNDVVAARRSVVRGDPGRRRSPD